MVGDENWTWDRIPTGPGTGSRLGPPAGAAVRATLAYGTADHVLEAARAVGT